MSRIRIVGGSITKTTEGAHHMYSEENIVFNSSKAITEVGGENGIVYGEPKDAPKRESNEEIIEITSKLYSYNNSELKIPYIDTSNLNILEGSKPFIAGIKSIFGDDIKHTSAKKLMLDILNGNLKYPTFKIDKGLSNSQAGYYIKETIYLNEKLILESEKSPKKSWLLFRVMIEEIGHYIDDILRTRYDSIGGDAKGDEGKMFAADFIKFNKLLSKDFEFAHFKIKASTGKTRDFIARVNFNEPNRELKSKDLLFVGHDDDDHGVVTLKSGKTIKVEFFKIRGGGAIHEAITKKAAKIAGVLYDFRLDEGSAWPDVPCQNENSIETCYYNTWNNEHTKGTLAFESHHGTKQYWHSMAPTGNNTNKQVVELIIIQAKKWFTKGIETFGDNGLFHIGKILHMVQDSYSLSHVYRDKDNKVVQIQSYEAQDSDKHGEPDKKEDTKGVKDAETASVWILTLYKISKKEKELKSSLLLLDNYLRTIVYPLAKDRSQIIAGGSLEAYKKSQIKKADPKIEKMVEDERLKMMREPKI
ncbi:hypothetical protein FNW52_09355 [Flavobacterium sp. ZT3R18]|uniref:hypothetical protein n=1 Tax=Flavobacterium sp. ZT3R18 TaxID=2594429 RepID=UPI00117B150E|nr:hypothetical protein [Flavobacterium sp. ZT3R18]TRX36222.1 hypothetical protein FNW52_09355 [Flavobacterium sp. ZT3R18]